MSGSPPALSVLDLVPVRAGQRTCDALRASLALARVADELGYRRYWVAEHHNMPAVAATNPAVLIGLIAAATSGIRVGSGGVMLPNHAPLVIAEQFALLEAAFPGRIDLGIGRAPGSDPVTAWALRSGRDDGVDSFAQDVLDLIALMSPGGVELNLQGRPYELRATPAAAGSPPVWLLGSSDYSARLAAARGLPYVFAHHFSGQGTGQALSLYRNTFVPSAELAAPRTLLTANVIVAADEATAIRLARPQQLAMVALRTGQPLRPALLVPDAEKVVLGPEHQRLADAMLGTWIVGDPAQVAARITALARQFEVDEVMVNPIAGALPTDAADQAPARERTLRLLSQALAG